MKRSSIGKRFLKLFAWTVFSVFILFMAVIAYAYYLIHSSKTVATDFCNSIQVNEDISEVIARADADNISHPASGFQSTPEQESFFKPGFIYSFSACVVTLSRGKVASRKVMTMHDNEEVLSD